MTLPLLFEGQIIDLLCLDEVNQQALIVDPAETASRLCNTEPSAYLRSFEGCLQGVVSTLQLLPLFVALLDCDPVNGTAEKERYSSIQKTV